MPEMGVNGLFLGLKITLVFEDSVCLAPELISLMF